MQKIAMALFLLVLAFSVQAQDSSELAVAEMVFCTGMEERVPTNADTSFTNDVERVYCFTQITGAPDTTSVTHIWYHNDEEKARVKLKVGVKAWRTWSSKAIWKNWVGKWHVSVVAANGKVLETKSFAIKAK